MTQHIVLDIDGQQHAVDADPDMPLLYALRDHLQFDNPRFGCGLGQCGASRYTSMARQRAAAARIVTLAGLGTPEGSVRSRANPCF
jgi:nicotinate dehydrogenase subunit A